MKLSFNESFSEVVSRTRLPQPCSELSGAVETLKPKRDPSKKIHIYRAGQVPGWVADEEQVEIPASKSKQKGKNRAAQQRARVEAEEGDCHAQLRAYCRLQWAQGLVVFQSNCSYLCLA